MDALMFGFTAAASVLLAAEQRRFEAWARWMALGSGGLLVAHFATGGVRWQLLPLYGTVLSLVLFAVRESDAPQRTRLLGATSVVLVLLAFGLHTVLPPLVFPEPSGTFAVGTRRVVLQGEDEPLRMVLWYPVDEVGRTAPYGEDELVERIADAMGLRPFLLEHVRRAETGATRDAVPTGALVSLPAVIVFTDTTVALPTLYTRFGQALAGRGYVVAVTDARDVRGETTAVRVLDWFEDLLPRDPHGALAFKVDASMIAIAGHGSGARAAVRACEGNSWFKAALLVDPAGLPAAVEATRPVMVVGEGAVPGGTEACFVVDRDDASLWDLTDLPLVNGGMALGVTHPTGRVSAFPDILVYGDAFLDRFLKDERPDMLEESAPPLHIIRPPLDD